MLNLYKDYPKAPSVIVFTMVKSLIEGIPFVISGEVGFFGDNPGDRNNLGESVLSNRGDSITARSACRKALILSFI